MADMDLVTKKDINERANKIRKEEIKKHNDLRDRRIGMNVAYRQFKHDGTEGIETEPGMVSKLFGATKDDPKYQAAREMKKALESERARINIPKAMDDEADMQKRLKDAGMKKGGKVKASSASKRADGCCVKGKTKGRMI